MPNGHYHAQCHNCTSYAYRKRGRCCKKHDFVMPRVREVICRDWQVSEKEVQDKPWAFGFVPALLASEEFRSLLPGVLYHYHYFSDSPPEKLGSFEDLQHLILTVSIHDDSDLGWVLHPSVGDYDLFPGSGSSVTLRLDGVDYRYDIADLPQQRVTGGHRTPSGAWEATYNTTMQRVVYSTMAPSALHDWLAARLDLDAYWVAAEAHEFRESLRDAGITVFLAGTDEANVYRLYQIDGILYGRYQWQDSM